MSTEIVNVMTGIDTKNIILAFDPGRDKTGFAFVNPDGTLIVSGIFPTQEKLSFFTALKSDSHILAEFVTEGRFTENLLSRTKFIAVGNGTHSKEFAGHVRDNLSLEIITVDEKFTTLEARKLYWQIHKPGFLQRIIPESMRVPSRILDDLAAWAIALRAAKKYRDIRANKL